MIRPPRGTWVFISWTAWWAHRKVPVRLVSTARCQPAGGDLVNRARRTEHARVVNQQINPLPSLLDGIEQRGDRLWHGDVGENGKTGSRWCRGRGQGLLQWLFAAPRCRDPPSSREQCLRYAPAKTRSRPGHHGHTSGCRHRPAFPSASPLAHRNTPSVALLPHTIAQQVTRVRPAEERRSPCHSLALRPAPQAGLRAS
jgi:hypothetical protein